MRKLKEYNTAVIATDKNGNKVQYKSLEEASKETGLSVRAIKSRCLKHSTSKDGLLFSFVNISTQRAFQAKRSKAKGNSYELKIIHDLEKLGFKGLKSSRNMNKILDSQKIDIAETEDKLSCYIQCKATKNIPSIATISEECELKDRPLAIFWYKQNASEKIKEFVCIPKDYFYKLLLNEKINN